MGICLIVGDSPEKSGLIPHTPYGESWGSSDLALLDEPALDLVGGVKAYQGNDL